MTLTLKGGEVILQQQDQQANKKKGLLPKIVERFVKRSYILRRC